MEETEVINDVISFLPLVSVSFFIQSSFIFIQIFIFFFFLQIFTEQVPRGFRVIQMFGPSDYVIMLNYFIIYYPFEIHGKKYKFHFKIRNFILSLEIILLWFVLSIFLNRYKFEDVVSRKILFYLQNVL